jgi:aspartyl-tRNA synthetase
MHAYRSHTCAALRTADAGETVRLSGWVHRKRDHGGVLFMDLRDHYGLTQCVVGQGSPVLAQADALRPESVVTITGEVVRREGATVNPRLPTGEVEVRVRELTVQSEAAVLPIQVAGEAEFPEDLRLRYRFLDLRRERQHRNIMLRAGVIASIRRRMIEAGFTEFQTPILTASSPEGARDYLGAVPPAPGTFYALPQAPQQFKQLAMVAGFDRYFQIAPCFRDESSRADRSPGEFYQLDFEMSFVTQEDVFAAIEPVLAGVFEEFADWSGTRRAVTPAPFPRIPFDQAMLEFGSDKPDLRNPLRIRDVTEHFRGGAFGLFARNIEKGAGVRAIPAPGAGASPRSFFDKLNEWAREQGAGGLGYITFEGGEGARPDRPQPGARARGGDPRGLRPPRRRRGVLRLRQAGRRRQVRRAGPHAPRLRTRLVGARRLPLLLGDGLPDVRAERGHRPDRVQPQPLLHAPGRARSAGHDGPAGDQGLPVRHRLQRHRAVLRRHPQPPPRHHAPRLRHRRLHGRARRGALRRHAERLPAGRPAARGIGAGYRPHRHAAGGRAQHPRVILFPMNQQAEDLMMGAPAPVEPARLKELHIRLDLPPQKGEGRGAAGGKAS